MFKLPPHLTLSLCLSAATVGWPFSGNAQDPNYFAIKRLDWKAPIGSATTLSITNPLGDVRLRTWSLREVEVIITSQSLQAGQTDVELKSLRRPDALELLVYHPLGQNFSGRADVGLRVLDSINVNIETRNGYIEAKGLTAHVSAQSQSGDIFIRAVPSLAAATKSGAIFAIFERVESTAHAPPFTLKTHTGEITLHVALPANFRIEASTGASIAVAGPTSATLSNSPGVGTSRTLLLGDASQIIRVESATGDISIFLDEPQNALRHGSTEPLTQPPAIISPTPPWRPGAPIMEVPKGRR